MLFINEIQSDWGQEGKKKGFADPDAANKLSELSAQYDKLGEERRAAEKEMADLPDFNERFSELQDRVEAINSERDKVSDKMAELRQSVKGNAIPAAPFVTKTDAWVSLAIKRMIRYAVENGFDRVAFINGQQAADLYDLSKQIDRVQYTKWSDGKVGVEVYDKKGYLVALPNHQADGYSIDELPGLLGKEIADKIANGKARMSAMGVPASSLALT